MPEYVIRNGDTQYRLVNVMSETVPEFRPAPHVGQRIAYTENQVLEIMHEDGTTELEYNNDRGRTEVRCELVGNQPLCYKLNVEPRYTARMWLEVDGMRYKIPGRLQPYVDAAKHRWDKTCVFLVGNGLDHFRIVGDRYIEKLFRFPE